jgi:molybdenum cofactor cytidylyltransferase
VKASLEHQPLAAVVLAAGYSSRMKQWKPGLLVRGNPLIVHALLPALDAVHQIILVGGFQFDELKGLVLTSGRLNESQKKQITFVENKEFSSGMFSSIQLGLSYVRSFQDGSFIVPGDMPLVSPQTYESLASALATESVADVFIPGLQIDPEDTSGEKRIKKGHPILIRNRAFSRILSEGRTSILRDVLKQLPSHMLVVRDPGICFDIDEEGDIAKLESLVPSIRHQKIGSSL